MVGLKDYRSEVGTGFLLSTTQPPPKPQEKQDPPFPGARAPGQVRYLKESCLALGKKSPGPVFLGNWKEKPQTPRSGDHRLYSSLCSLWIHTPSATPTSKAPVKVKPTSGNPDPPPPPPPPPRPNVLNLPQANSRGQPRASKEPETTQEPRNGASGKAKEALKIMFSQLPLSRCITPVCLLPQTRTRCKRTRPVWSLMP